MTLPALTTERLWLRPLRTEDADDLHLARGDSEAMRWWYAGTSPSVDATRSETAEIAAWGTHWSFGRAGSAHVLGYVGFLGLAPGEGCGFGYLLRRSEWGSGLVVEAASAVLAHGFDIVGIAHAELWIHPGNAQSVRVAEKLGARFRGWAYTGRLSLVHGITDAEWRKDPRPPIAMTVIPVLGVDDLDAAVARWCEAFGFRLGWSSGGVAQVLPSWTGGAAVRLIRGARPGSVLVQVSVTVDEVVGRAAVAGWDVVAAAEPKSWGTVDATLADPDGNRVTVQGS